MKPYDSMDGREKLFVTHFLVDIVRIITHTWLCEVLEHVFGNVDTEEVTHLLSILIAAGYIERDSTEPEYVRVATHGDSLIELG